MDRQADSGSYGTPLCAASKGVAVARHRPFVLLALLLAFAALAAPTPAAARDCESWSGGQQVRCLSSGEAAVAGESVAIKNLQSAPASFSVQEWYSTCGRDSVFPGSMFWTYTLPADGVAQVALTPFPDPQPLGPTPCTEMFIQNCQADGSPVDCRSLLSTDIGPAAGAPPATHAEPRPCEAWKGDLEYRCLSQGQESEPLTVQNLSPLEVVFTLQTWSSYCGSPSFKHSTADQHRAHPDETLHLTLGGYLPDGTHAGNPTFCGELYLFDCNINGLPAACGPLLKVQVGG